MSNVIPLEDINDDLGSVSEKEEWAPFPQGFEILDYGPWVSVKNLKTQRSKDKKKAGIYQVVHSKIKPADDLSVTHANIGYTGKSANITDRTYHIRNGAQGGQVGKHPAGKYVYKQGFDLDEIWVRKFLVEDALIANSLETWVQEESTKLNGYKYKWLDASQSKANKVYHLIGEVETMTATDFFNELLPAVRKNLNERLINGVGSGILDGSIKLKF